MRCDSGDSPIRSRHAGRTGLVRPARPDLRTRTAPASSGWRVVAAACLLAAGLALAGGCGDRSGKPGGGGPAGKADAPDATDDALIARYGGAEIPMVRYEWDRNAGDPSVPAELGGPGFTGEGWTTCLEFPARGWKDAPKGGTVRMYLSDWPSTLRMHGENWNESFNYNVAELALEVLVTLHPVTMQAVPHLATHWKISPDGRTYTYRINPEARFSDGSEVTAADVVATWKLHMDPKTRYPSEVITMGKFEEPVAKSKYVLEVRCKEDDWRNFIYFSGLQILPAKHVSIPGDEYLDRYQNAYTPMSGPYMVKPEDIRLGQSIALTRRTDWWGAKNPCWAGLFNIDRFEWEVVKDPNLALEKMKKGELDIYVVPKAQWWAQEIPKLDTVVRGLVRMKKIYNDAPVGTSGIAINMKKAPLDDVRIRRALQLLYNRPLMIRQLCFDEYEPLTSYYQGNWGNPGNREFPYDPAGAVELLEQAGWKDVNAELLRVKDGKVLEFEVIYDSPLSERFLTTFQADCRKAGIKLNLKTITPASLWKQVTEKQFELVSMAWGATVIPNPDSEWLGELADQPDNNNVVGFRDPKVDALIAEYCRAPDPAKRVAVMREIDRTVYEAHPYVLEWYLPSIRFIHWNRFGMPPWGTDRMASSGDAFWQTFWIDPEKEKALAAARRDAAAVLPAEERDNRFWRAWNAVQKRREQAGK